MERRLMIALGVILLAGVAYLGYQRFAGGQDNVRVQSGELRFSDDAAI